MKKYSTNEARKSAVEQIDKLINTIATISSDEIHHLEALEIIDILTDRKDDLLKEIYENKEGL